MLLRIALLLLLAWIAWRLLRTFLRKREAVAYEDMQRCTQCGAFLPRAVLAHHQSVCDRQRPQS